jgi:outer membrane lipoprotein-sorting protein
MLEAAFLIAQLFTTPGPAGPAGPADPLSTAIESYKKVETYSVTLRSVSKSSSEVIRYFYKSPKHVRMEFIKPHKGAVLVYDPAKGKVKVRPFGFLKPLVLSLSPDNHLVKSSKGHRVDESDIGALLNAADVIKSHGKVVTLRTEEVKGRESLVVSVTGDGGYTVYGEINRYLMWLDKELHLPLKVEAFGVEGDLIESVLMDDLEVNIEFEEGFFELN